MRGRASSLSGTARPRRPRTPAAVAMVAALGSPAVVAQEVPATGSAAPVVAPPELTPATLQRWRDFILPEPDEKAWEAIPWRESFWQAVLDGHAQRKPVLLWAMNGHPMGCT